MYVMKKSYNVADLHRKLVIKLSAWRNCSDECMPDIVHKKWHNRCMNRLSEIYLLLLQFLCGKLYAS